MTGITTVKTLKNGFKNGAKNGKVNGDKKRIRSPEIP